MRSSSTEQIQRALIVLVSFHIVIIGASNYLVQIPFQFFGVYTNWGTFSFPLVYLATDLTVRVFGSARARKIISDGNVAPCNLGRKMQATRGRCQFGFERTARPVIFEST